MDGRVDAIRAALDDAGFTNVAILSYAAKYARLLRPFRGRRLGAAVRRSARLSDDPANRREARERWRWISRRAPIWSWASRRSLTWMLSDVAAESPVPGPRITSAELRWSRGARGWIDERRVTMETPTQSSAPAPTSS